MCKSLQAEHFPCNVRLPNGICTVGISIEMAILPRSLMFTAHISQIHNIPHTRMRCASLRQPCKHGTLFVDSFTCPLHASQVGVILDINPVVK